MSDESQRTAEWLHGTVLNTIRYLLSTSVIDRESLAQFPSVPPADSQLRPGIATVLSECTQAVEQIASGAEVDDQMCRRLGILESRIRLHMLVDPDTDGAFAVWAMQIVDELATRGCLAQVKGISASADQRPVAGDVRSAVDQALALVNDGASVRVLTDGVEDFLSVAFPANVSLQWSEEELRSLGLLIGDAVICEECTVYVDVESADPDAIVTLVVSRRISLTETC